MRKTKKEVDKKYKPIGQQATDELNLFYKKHPDFHEEVDRLVALHQMWGMFIGINFKVLGPEKFKKSL